MARRTKFTGQQSALCDGKNENIKVMVRIRPPLIRELEDNESFISTIQVSEDRKRLCLYEYHNIEQVAPEQLEHFLEDQNNFSMNNFAFDNIYD